MEENLKDAKFVDFSGLKITLASPEVMTQWSYGEVTKPETINYRTFKPEKDGLFDERIFGPTKDYECYCGKYKRIRYKGIICDRCGVEITTNTVRRERMGHIKLAAPIAHIWYFKGASSPLSVLLDITSNNLERIIYYALYLVKDVDETKREAALSIVNALKDDEVKVLEEWKKTEEDKVEEELAKAKEGVEKKVKNEEQRELMMHETEFKFRERITSITQVFNEKKTEKGIFYERILKVIKGAMSLAVVEEEDYMFLREHEAHEFLQVGMGSEVILEVLSAMNLDEMYNEFVKKLIKAKGDKRTRLLKKVRLVESFIKSGVSPKWMVLVVLPIIPPDLRPVVQLSGGKFATSDLNDFYRRVINRNNRLKHLIELGAPEIILRNEKRMLQESVDSLIDLSKSRGGKTAQSRSKALKSLSDVLKGKSGRFRQNLLGKRVDYSGRSVIIVGPELALNQCGIPKEMALELFKPFLLREVIIRGHAQNIKSAKNFLETKDPIIYDILEEITRNHPVILNRAPTLHKLSILAFYPVLTDDYAIKLHPTVCQGYNADFDGDQMAIFVPLSEKSIEEVETRMMPQQNLLKPSDGTPIVVPNKEMALGAYYLTTFDASFNDVKDEELMHFSGANEALLAHASGAIATRQPMKVKIGDEIIKTTVGRIIFNSRLPEALQFHNEPVKAADLKSIVVAATTLFAGDEALLITLIDNLKAIGFWGATISGGVSVSLFDCITVPEREELIKVAEGKVKEIEDNYFNGLITEEEKKRLSNNVWIDITEDMANRTWDAIDEENPVKIIINSGGARASRENMKQLSAMKGLVIDPLGKIIEVPTKSNYRAGLTIFEYVINARGARKGLIDSALKTADAGYLTRRLVDVSHDMIIREELCTTTEGLVITKEGDRGEKFNDRVKGRMLLADATTAKGKVIVKAGTIITDEELADMSKNDVSRVTVRSALHCKTEYGVCQGCYGVDLSTHKLADVGVPTGVVAAQSIGEPGTQLTMRVRHFGGIVIADVTQGLPRVEELFEIRTPKVFSPISDVSGKVSIVEDTDRAVFVVKVQSDVDGAGNEREFIVPSNRKLKVKHGQLIASGQSLCEGYLDIKEVLSIKGLEEAQTYLLNEIQKVYESQGIAIHDKHFEVIIRKMSDKVIIENEGDTKFIVGEVVSMYRFERENKKVLAQGGRPAVGRVSILGITRAAMYSDSWLSSASFQGTTTILTEASIKGQVDGLLGLKENVIIGRLIPVTAQLLDKYYGAGGNSELSKDLPVEETVVPSADVISELSATPLMAEMTEEGMGEVEPGTEMVDNDGAPLEENLDEDVAVDALEVDEVGAPADVEDMTQAEVAEEATEVEGEVEAV